MESMVGIITTRVELHSGPAFVADDGGGVLRGTITTYYYYTTVPVHTEPRRNGRKRKREGEEKREAHQRALGSEWVHELAHMKESPQFSMEDLQNVTSN